MTTANLTLVAALPQAGGCMSSLPAERNEPAKVQMKAQYFQHDELEFPPIEPPTIEELAKKYLAAHEGLVE